MATITIGRSPQNTIVVDSSYTTVSSSHATISDNEGTLTLQDHSTNGTYINGQYIHNQSATIRQGDNITLGKQYQLSWREVMQYFGGSHATQRYHPTPLTQRDINPQPQFAQQINVNRADNPQFDRGTPQCIDKWNWGAFLLGWIWAIGNGVWWGLLGIIPYISFVINIILGITGNKSAWEKYHGSASEFDAKQRSWTKAGVVFFFISFIFGIIIGIASLS